MVSVCMTTYNGEKFVKKQVESILRQLNETDELIVSDDNSTDETLNILRQFNDSRIKIYAHKRSFIKKKHSSVYYCSNNFSNAIKHAMGDYIFLSDQDDIWYDNKVQRTLAELEKYDLCMANFSIIDSSERITLQKYFNRNPISKNWFINLNKNVYFGCCMAFRKECINLFMPIPHTIPNYDSWIGAVLHLKGKKIGFIEEPLIYYRRHDTNTSNATGNSKNSIFFRIYWRLQFLYTLIQYIEGKN